MKVFLAGGTGFLGSNLLNILKDKSKEIIIPSRKKRNKISKNVRFILADLTQKGIWEKEIEECDLIINLAGYPVYKPWTSKIRKLIWDTRITITQNIVEALNRYENKTLINASAIGIYGDQGENIITEETPPQNDNHFIIKLCKEWEKAALKASRNHKVVILRIGIVIGKGSHFEKALSFFTKVKIAPILCNPNQWISWIEIEDFVKAVIFILENRGKGIYNITSPTPLRQAEFFKKIFETKFQLQIPCSFLKFLGEQGKLFTWSQRVIPKKLLNEGFTFKGLKGIRE